MLSWELEIFAPNVRAGDGAEVGAGKTYSAPRPRRTSRAIIPEIFRRSTGQSHARTRAPLGCRAATHTRTEASPQPPGASFARVSQGRRLYSPCLVLSRIYRRGADALESRQDSISRPASDETIFYSVADNGSAIVDEMFEAVDGRVGRVFSTLPTRKRPSAVAGARVKKRQAGGRHEFARRDLCARAVVFARAPPASALARRANGSTGFQVNSSNRFSAQAEATHVTAGHDLPRPREARFQPAIAEQSFVQRTRPAVGQKIPTHLIFHTRPTPSRVAAASVARY